MVEGPFDAQVVRRTCECGRRIPPYQDRICLRCARMKASTLQDQIDAARKAVAEWPEWMRETAYFASPMIGAETTHNAELKGGPA